MRTFAEGWKKGDESSLVIEKMVGEGFAYHHTYLFIMMPCHFLRKNSGYENTFLLYFSCIRHTFLRSKAKDRTLAPSKTGKSGLPFVMLFLFVPFYRQNTA